MRMLVCGGRDFSDADWLGKILSSYRDVITEIIHGAAKGADTMAGAWARAHDIPVKEFPADWERYGKGAGPIRNMQMLHEGKPQLLLAFPGGSGTAHMVRIARREGVKILELKVRPW